MTLSTFRANNHVMEIILNISYIIIMYNKPFLYIIFFL